MCSWSYQALKSASISASMSTNTIITAEPFLATMARPPAIKYRETRAPERTASCGRAGERGTAGIITTGPWSGKEQPAC